MVDCTKCKHSTEWIAEFSENAKYKMYYCSLMDDSLPEVEAKNELDCEDYDEKLDDHKAEE